MGIKIRSDLFSENRLGNDRDHENIQENSSSYVVPSKEKGKLVKLSMKKKVTPKNLKNRKESNDETYTDDINQVCKIRCQVCEKKIVMSNMNKHITEVHCLEVNEYKEFYGYQNIVQKTYHRCGVCQRVLLFDILEIGAHLKKQKHTISLKEYSSRFLVNSVKIKEEPVKKPKLGRSSLYPGKFKKEEFKSLVEEQINEKISSALEAGLQNCNLQNTRNSRFKAFLAEFNSLLQSSG